MRNINKFLNIIEPASRAIVFVFFGYNLSKGAVFFWDSLAVLICVYITITEIRRNYETQIHS